MTMTATAIESTSEYRNKSFSDVYQEKLKMSDKTDNISCNGDSCEVRYTDRTDASNGAGTDCDESTELKKMVQGLPPEAKDKLLRWMGKMEPMDYDAPGSQVREQGV